MSVSSAPISVAMSASVQNTQSIFHQLENEDDLSLLEKTLRVIKDATWGVIFLLQKDTNYSSFIISIVMILETLQLLSFPFYALAQFAWNSRATDWFIQLTNSFRFYYFVETSPYDSIRSLAIFALVMVALFFALFASVALQFYFSALRFQFTLQSLRILTNGLIGIFFVPIIGALTLMLGCHDEQPTCWTGTHLISAMFCLVFGLAFIGFSLLLSLTYYDRDPTSSYVLATPNNKITTYTLLFKTVCAILYALLTDHSSVPSSSVWILLIFTLSGSIFLAYVVTMQVPYFHWNWSVARAAQLWIVAWASIAALVVRAINTPQDSGVTIMFFLGTPLVLSLCYAACSWRRRSVLEASFLQLKSPEEVELKARFILEPVTEVKRHGAVLMLLAKNEQLLKDEENERLLEEIEEMYKLSQRRFGNEATIHIIVAQYFFIYGKRHVAMQALNKVDSRMPKLGDMYSAYVMRKLNEEFFASSESNKDIIDYISFEQTMADAKRLDEKANRAQAMFWEELLQTYVDVNKLHKIAFTIHETLAAANDKFRKLVRINPNSTSILRQYGGFLIEIANEPVQGTALLVRAEELEDSHSRGKGLDRQDNLFDDRNAVIIVSGDPDSLGLIVNCNLGCVRLLGYSRGEIVQSDISMLMPDPYRSHHTGFMRRYVETGQSTLIGSSRNVFALHRSGYVLPVELRLRVFSAAAAQLIASSGSDKAEDFDISFSAVATSSGDSNNASSFLGVLTHQLNTLEHFALIDSNNLIQYGTSGISGLFGVTPEDMRNGLVNIENWIGDFANILPSLKSAHEGLLATLDTLRGTLNLKLFAQDLIIEGDPWVVLRLCEEKVVTLSRKARQLQSRLHGLNTSTNSQLVKADPQFANDMEADEDTALLADISEPNSPKDEVELLKLSHQTTTASSPTHLQAPKKFKSGYSPSPYHTPTPLGSNSQSPSPLISSSFQFSSSSSAFAAPPEPFSSQPNSNKFNDSRSLASSGVLSRSKLHSRISKRSTHSLKEDDNASQHSGGSKGSNSSATSKSSLLQRRIRQLTSNTSRSGLEPALRRLRLWIILALSAMMICSIIRFAQMTVLLNSYITRMNHADMAARRHALVVSTAYRVYEILLANQGYYSIDAAAHSRSELKSISRTLEEYNQVLFNGFMDIVSNDMIEAYTKPSTKVWRLLGGKYSTDTVSLWTGLRQFSSTALLVSELPVSRYSEYNEDVFYILANSRSDFFSKLANSGLAYQRLLLDHVFLMKQWALSLCLISLFLLIIVMIFFVCPEVLKVESSKDSVILMFCDIPKASVRAIHRRLVQRLFKVEQARRDYLDEGQFDFLDDTPEDDELITKKGVEATDIDDIKVSVPASSTTALSNPVPSGGASTPTNNNSEQSSADKEKAKKDKEAAEDAADRKNKGSAQNATGTNRIRRFFVLAKVNVYCIIAVIYAVVSYYTEFGNYERLLQTAPSSVGLSLDRLLYSRLTILSLLTLACQNVTSPASSILSVSPTYISAQLDRLNRINDALMFGSAEFNVDPPTGALSDMLIANSCIIGAPSGCATFGNGIFGQGLYTAVLRFKDQGVLALDAVNVSVSALSPSIRANTTAFFQITNASISTSQLLWMRSSDDLYLSNLVDTATSLYRSDTVNVLQSSSTSRVIALVVMGVITFFLYIFFYNNLIWNMNTENLHTSKLLLMIPADLMSKMPKLVSFFDQMINNSLEYY